MLEFATLTYHYITFNDNDMNLIVKYNFDADLLGMTDSEIRLVAFSLADGLRPGKVQTTNLGLLTYKVDRVSNDEAYVRVFAAESVDYSSLDNFEDFE